MSILFCTPCYGGQVTMPFMESCLALQRDLTEAGVGHDFLFGANESLVQRARNTQATTFLKTGFRKMMFIDADIEFDPESVARLWNLDADVAVGLYPMKKEGCPLAAWVGGRMIDLKDCPDQPFPVDYAGTGFMMIDRRVFERFQASYPERWHDEGIVGMSFAYFNPRVERFGKRESGADDRVYLSEDYSFCRDWRTLGGEILADPGIKLTHWGVHAYRA